MKRVKRQLRAIRPRRFASAVNLNTMVQRDISDAVNRRIFPLIHTHSNAYIASYFGLKGPTAYPGKWNVSSCAYSRPRCGSASLLVLRALLLPYDPVAASTARPARPDRMYCQLAHSLPVAGAGSQNSVGCETARAQPRWVGLDARDRHLSKAWIRLAPAPSGLTG